MVEEGKYVKFVRSFTDAIGQVKKLLHWHSVSGRVDLSEVNEKVKEVELNLRELQSFAQKEAEFADEAERVITLSKAQLEYVDGIMSTLPERLPGRKKRGREVRTDGGEEEKEDSKVEAPSKNKSVQEESTGEEVAKKKAKIAEQRVVLTLSYLTVSELEACPKYMKGRLTLDKVNEIVDSLNGLITTKYELLRKPIRQLSASEAKAGKKFRETENRSTRGKTFFAEGDLRGVLRLDSTGKSLLSILRHTNRLKEKRERSITRYFLQ